MAEFSTTSKTRRCEACGTEFTINRKYSRAQAAKARFCSPECSWTSRPTKPKRTIYELLGGATRFGMFTVIGEGDPIQTKSHPLRRAMCRCDCGEIRLVQPAKLKSGHHQSCGCLAAEQAREQFTKHGGSGTPEYSTWRAMQERCHNPSHVSWAQYGGRGIFVCERWRGPDGFLHFTEDMGPRPERTTIDRIDGAKGYEPGNCRWATAKDQSANRRNSILLTFNGETLPLSEWTERLGCGKNTIDERLRRGWSVERALSTPP